MNSLPQGLNFYLIGLMGSGKTTVGKALAEKLSYRFFDTDAVIERAAQQSIAQIFATSGEASFRHLETQVLAELSAYRKLAIATGGGIVLDRQNWSYLKHGLIVWLDISVEDICDRLQGDTSRPLLQGADPHQKLCALLEERRPLYAQADLQVSLCPGETPEDIALRILAEVPKILKTSGERSG
ncbi:MAG: shikimate kinase [Drouetiella hepatica Uher 2000/2452]|jgi:shikimate kinase|uniref:Shikimate kinase n=1 Tax=Drouetiella hepatica Uher 2000/2452 TaxID=904376 RepID=A0A951ULK9_9CYAN|nr:shikimate kinase [Drouetiella hepatica Uher 2000/2452]